MRDGENPKKPREASRIIRALRGKVKKAVGHGWQGILIEWVKSEIRPCIKKPKSFDQIDYAQKLENAAKWAVFTYCTPIVSNEGRNGGKLEL